MNEIGGIVLTAMCFIAMSACDVPSYTHFEDIDSGGWNTMRIVEFTNLPDSMTQTQHPDRNYDMLICLRYQSALADSVINIKMEEESLAGGESLKILTVPLKNRHGEWRGRGSHGVYTLTDTLKRNWHPEAGYSVAFSSMDNKPEPKGITQIGIQLR